MNNQYDDLEDEEYQECFSCGYPIQKSEMNHRILEDNECPSCGAEFDQEFDLGYFLGER